MTDLFKNSSLGFIPEYEDFTAEIVFKEEFLSLITQDEGYDNLRIEIHPREICSYWTIPLKYWTIPLKEFLLEIKHMKKRLWDLRITYSEEERLQEAPIDKLKRNRRKYKTYLKHDKFFYFVETFYKRELIFVMSEKDLDNIYLYVEEGTYLNIYLSPFLAEIDYAKKLLLSSIDSSK